MKLLCLHGYGTSATIFEQQLARILEALGDEHEYVFLEGEVQVAKSGTRHLLDSSAILRLTFRTELSGVFPGPYLTYYSGSESEPVRLACELITATLEAADEPFDGIVGFSQGGGLAMTYLIQHQILFPHKPPPFHFALFFSPGAIISPDPKYGQKEIMSFMTKLTIADEAKLHEGLAHDITTRRYGGPDGLEGAATFTPQDLAVANALMGTASAVVGTRNALQIDDYNPLFDANSQDITAIDFPRFFHPVYTPQRVTIPTVHVVGRNDVAAIRQLESLAQELCSGGKVDVIEHEGSHDVPRKEKDVEVIVRAIERAHYFGKISAAVA